MVWGYVLGRAASRYGKTTPSIPLLILAGALPDFDLFTGQPFATLFGHHGLSHSWLVICGLSIPFFVVFGKQTLPYFLAVVQHLIFGDLVTNNIPILFPFTHSGYGVNLSEWNPPAAVGLEILGFVIFLSYFLSSGDWKYTSRSPSWDKLWFILWLPGLGLTIGQAFLYYVPDPVAIVYAAYALVSSFFILGTAILMATRSMQRK